MNRKRLRKLRVFILLTAIHCFVLLPIMTTYSQAESNLHLEKGKSYYNILEYGERPGELEKSSKVEDSSHQEFAWIYKYSGLTYDVPEDYVIPESREYYTEAVDVAGNVSTKGNSDFALGIEVKAKASKKPFYKKWWFWTLVAGAGVAAASSGGGGSDAPSTGTVTISGPTP